MFVNINTEGKAYATKIDRMNPNLEAPNNGLRITKGIVASKL
jgi:hypothetical protein